MLTFNEIKKGVLIVLKGQPYKVLEACHLKMAQRRPVLQTKLKNLVTGELLSKNFQQSDLVEEAEIVKFQAKFLYQHKNRYFFADQANPKKRFDFSQEQLGDLRFFLKPGQIVQALTFQNKIISIELPIKITLKVIEAPPALKGDSAQSPTKTVTLETGFKLATPIFIKEGDLIEINTETGEYVRRI